MRFVLQIVIRALSRFILLGAVLMAPVGAFASDTAMPMRQMGGVTSTALLDESTADECCNGVKYVAPPCEHASLCIAKAEGMRHASTVGQGTYTGVPRAPSRWWSAMQDSGRRSSIRSDELERPRGPDLSILFCSFQT
jgi:hypothetical protein